MTVSAYEWQIFNVRFLIFKIAEGGQAEIYGASAPTCYGVVVKVFKEG